MHFTLLVLCMIAFSLGGLQVNAKNIYSDLESRIQGSNPNRNSNSLACPPEIKGVPADITVDCDKVPAIASVSATSCCEPVSIAYDTTKVLGNICGDDYIITRIWTATDNCGNTTTVSQKITVIDTIKPVIINPPGDITTDCKNVPDVPQLIATDNCDNLVFLIMLDTLVKGKCSGEFFISRTWIARDNCDNADIHVQLITVIDNGVPTFIKVPEDVTLSCEEGLPGYTPGVDIIVDEKCGPVAITHTDELLPGNLCLDAKIWKRTFLAKDDCGNSATAVQHIVFHDQKKPIFLSTPLDVSVNCDLPNIPDPAVSDNCDNNVDIAYQDQLVSGSSCDGLYVRTWSATDNCNNTATITQNIYVKSGGPITFQNVPADITVDCDKIPGNADITAKNGCGFTATVTHTESKTAGSCPGNYTLKRIYIASDDCGNTASTAQTIQVIDAINPGFSNFPNDITISCGGTIPPPANVIATDHCDSNPTIKLQENQVGSGVPCKELSVTRTWTAEDHCGNKSTKTQNIYVGDDKAPTFVNVPANITINCNDITPSIPNPSVSDDCDKDVVVTSKMTKTQGNCPVLSVIAVTWTATDDCGNTATAQQVISILDHVAPTIGFKNPLLTGLKDGDTVKVPCGFPGFNLDDLDVKEKCSKVFVVMVDTTIYQKDCTTIIACHITARDECNNIAHFTFYVRMEDKEAPVLNPTPADLTIDCNQSVPNPPVVTATDKCDFSIQVSYMETKVPGTCPSNYMLIRKWTATDDCGNTVIHTQKISVGDYAGPIITPKDLTLVNGGTYEMPCDQIMIMGPNDATVTDNCDKDIKLTWHETSKIGNCKQDGYYLFMTCWWEATDACGNVSKFIIYVKIVDHKAPVISNVPANITIQCGDPIPSVGNPTATDNCSKNPTITFNENKQNGSCPENYTIIRTWTAMDECGNMATGEQTITVQDTKKPEFTFVPSDKTIECDDTNAFNEKATAKDNCDSQVDVTRQDSNQNGNCAGGSKLTITWTATDNCGNTATAITTISYKDSKAPTLTNPPADQSAECDAIPNANSTTITLQAHDNCDPNPTITYTGEQKEAGICAESYKLIRTWKVSDACGNVSTYKQTISVKDTKAPTFTNIPKDKTLECDVQVPSFDVVNASDNCDNDVIIKVEDTKVQGSCPQNYTLKRLYIAQDNCGNTTTAIQTLTISDTKAPVWEPINGDILVECDKLNTIPTPKVKDNCDSEPTITKEEKKFNGKCADSYLLVRTFTAVDDCGNSSTTAQVIKVSDSTPPTFVDVPKDLTLECDQVAPGAGIAKATDNCDSDVKVTVIDVKQTGNCTDSYVLIRTYTAEDNCGNTTTAVQKITVGDSKKPIFSNVPADLTLECDNVTTGGTPTVTDNCDNQIDMVYSESKQQGNCPQSYVLTRSWTATDNCGNSASVSQKITVVDTKAPQLSNVPVDITVDCDKIPGIPNNITAKDNCDNNVTPQFNEVKPQGNCNNNNVLIRTWTATDACGNKSTATQHITVTDQTKPVFTSTPNPVTIECDETVPGAGQLTASDNCDTQVDITSVDTKVSGNCPHNYTIIRIYTAKDDCGNTSTVSATITVKDTKAPVLVTMPQDVVVTCDNVPGPANPTVSDQCDTNPKVTYSDNKVGTGCSYIIIRTWKAEDACGNVTTKDQLIKVTDNTPPVFMPMHPDLNNAQNGSTLTVNCDAVPSFTESSMKAKDVCDANPTLTFNKSDKQGNCITDGYFVQSTFTWTAKDACGNQSTFTIIVQVKDTKAPQFTTVPQDITIGCKDPIPSSTASATDNCDQNVQVTHQDNTTPLNCGSKISRVFTGVDDCGNAATVVQMITILDNSNPVFVNVPADVTVDLDKGEQVPSIPIVTANDDCDNNVTVTFTQNAVPTGTCDSLITRTWKATDDCNHVTTASQQILVLKTCPCVPPVITSVDTKKPDCNELNGCITVNVPNMSEYDFIWLPSIGTPGSTPNIRCGLPAGNYAVIIHGKNDPNCYIKEVIKLTTAQPCGDTMKVTLNFNQSKTVCVDNFISIPNSGFNASICGMDAAKMNATVIQGTACVTLTPVNGTFGQTLVCVNHCDVNNPNVCEKTYILVTVKEKNGPTNLIAVDDQAKTKGTLPVMIQVLGNDIMPAIPMDKFEITLHPTHGKSTVVNNYAIEFQPEKGYCGSDRFTYMICIDGFCDEADVDVDVTCNGLVIFTGFSPNNDGLNDVLTVANIDQYPDNELWIFNRWGHTVFHTKSYQNDWNGTWNGNNIPDGTYYYILNDGEGNTVNGYIQVRR